ncbi:MAG: glycosyltransferase family 2 protein [Phycisphaerales bacterium]|nr:glycosyltransferase family 2 protein [Phycisphaerales bacterium]
MEVSVIIPTFGRPRQIVECVRRLASQTLDACEVLVGIDGGRDAPDESGAIESALRGVWRRGEGLQIERCPKVGLAAVRNALLPRARGRIMVSLNDDVLPEPDLLAQHAGAHTAGAPPVVVVGHSPWLVQAPDRLFDRLIRETSMVFFYDQMEARLASGEVGPDHDWGFRHCWGLNFSPLRLVREVGGFTVYPATYGYEDNEMAFRLHARFGTPVVYRPRAVAGHDHRMEPEGYLAREYKLGYAALGFARASPECSAAMFGRDVASEAELAYSRAFVERERGLAARVRAVFCELAQLPSDAVPGREHPAGAAVIQALYQQHLLLKRWEWRRGLVDGAEVSG